MSRELWVIAGPNGSGKTTWVEALLEIRTDLAYLSADAIAAELSPERPEKAQFEAGRRFLEALARGLDEGRSLVVESTLAGLGMQRFFQRARTRGYRIVVLFVFVETVELCVQRVAQRVLKGGHDVPEVDIRRRYPRSLARFWRLYRLQAHEWHLVYNARESFELVALGSKDRTEVLDDYLFESFRQQGVEL